MCVGADENLLNSSNHHHLFELVLDWARNTLEDHKAKTDFLTEQVIHLSFVLFRGMFYMTYSPFYQQLCHHW